jgi:hypothetical protein
MEITRYTLRRWTYRSVESQVVISGAARHVQIKNYTITGQEKYLSNTGCVQNLSEVFIQLAVNGWAKAHLEVRSKTHVYLYPHPSKFMGWWSGKCELYLPYLEVRIAIVYRNLNLSMTVSRVMSLNYFPLCHISCTYVHNALPFEHSVCWFRYHNRRAFSERVMSLSAYLLHYWRLRLHIAGPNA